MRNIRNELGKLIAYAKAHGVSVFIHPGSSDVHDADWTTDGKKMYIYEEAPLRQYLRMLHELAHHRQFIQDGLTVPFKIDRAYRKDANLSEGEVLDKKYRKLIYETEKRDARHQLDIHYETQSTIPVELVKREIEYDLWVYKVWMRTGSVPSKKEGKEMRKSLTKKWKSGRVK